MSHIGSGLPPILQIASKVSMALLLLGVVAAPLGAADFITTPARVSLTGNLSRAQLLVTAGDGSGGASQTAEDLTHQAVYSASNPEVVQVSATGRLLAASNGHAIITVKVDDSVRQVEVQVTGVVPTPVIDFSEHVLPILSKAGCNAGACHASQYGKGGFILSVFGYLPEDDLNAIVRDGQQRRVNFVEPEKSLLLMKPTMQIPHGGSRRLEMHSADYQLLAHWIAQGAPGPRKDARKVVKLEVLPRHRVGEIGLRQQLQVTATLSDGFVRDITAWAKFDSMDDSVLSVSKGGLVTAVGNGQAPIMVRFEGEATIAMLVVPFASSANLAKWKDNNFIDHFAAEKFRELGITPSPLCDDPTFVRRSYLDAIGTLPTPEESIAFIDSTDPDKRQKLVDQLLGLTGDAELDTHNDQYAAFWTIKWSDLIRANSRDLGEQGMWALHNWIKDAFRRNKPFDQFARELVTAKGSIFSNGPANYFRISNNPSDLAETTAQLFLGLRLQCAKCHHHPFEKYGQEDYYGFAAFFARVGTKRTSQFGLFGQEQVVLVRSNGEVSHPRTGLTVRPLLLDGRAADDPLDRRVPLARWLTSSENTMFARNVVNRYLGYLLGRGLVEPIDDLRATNPPSNPALMDALSEGFIKSGFDLKRLMRTIMTSRLYQIDSQPTPGNALDQRFYSHYRVKRLAAEPLLDAVDFATGTKTKFLNLPLQTRAIELPDADYPDYFLNKFAKPKRMSVCECERTTDENLAQALHTLNGDIVAQKIADPSGRVAKALSDGRSHEEIVTELFLTALSRRPTDAELDASRRFLTLSPTPTECYEDLLWTLINSKQFLYVQ